MNFKKPLASLVVGFVLALGGVACGDDEGVPPDAPDNGNGVDGGGVETFTPEPEGTGDEGVPPDEEDDG